MAEELGPSLLDQGKVIASYPGLDIVELPVNRYMFGDYDMRNPLDRARFEDEASGDLKLEYRRQLQREDLGLGPKQEIWLHRYPHWEKKTRPIGEMVVVDFAVQEQPAIEATPDRQVA